MLRRHFSDGTEADALLEVLQGLTGGFLGNCSLLVEKRFVLSSTTHLSTVSNLEKFASMSIEVGMTGEEEDADVVVVEILVVLDFK